MRGPGLVPTVGAKAPGSEACGSVGAAERRCIVVHVDIAIVARELVVELGRRRVLRGLTFGVPAGQVTGLLGPSGCGKTTLMRCVVGVAQITRARLDVLGRPAGAPPLRHRIGYVTQGASVYTDLTVGRTCATSPRCTASPPRRADRCPRRRRAHRGRHPDGRHALRRPACRVSLAVRPRRPARTYSSSTNPPSASTRSCAATSGTASTTSPRRGRRLLVSSHVMDKASRCHRLLLMREGSLVADASPLALEAATGATDIEEAFLSLVRQHTP